MTTTITTNSAILDKFIANMNKYFSRNIVVYGENAEFRTNAGFNDNYGIQKDFCMSCSTKGRNDWMRMLAIDIVERYGYHFIINDIYFYVLVEKNHVALYVGHMVDETSLNAYATEVAKRSDAVKTAQVVMDVVENSAVTGAQYALAKSMYDEAMKKEVDAIKAKLYAERSKIKVVKPRGKKTA